MIKTIFAFVSIAVIALAVTGWSRTGFDRAMIAYAATAQAPTPTVSVTTLPAMPGATKPPSSAPATQEPVMPLLTPPPPVPPGGAPTAPPIGVAYIQIEGQVSNPLSITLSQLQRMKPISLTLHFHTYTGVPLTELIAKAQPTFSDDPETLMRKYVYFQGFDGKSAILSFPEFSQQFNGQLVVLAYLVDLKDVKPPGFVQLVVQGDKSNARFIKVARIVIGEPPTLH
jgi:DMSO/TMAO reductase YedYZ molybdopterin-dependent catalytic subunit